MKVFCPSCAHAQEGQPGARLTCPVCTSAFEVPRSEAAPVATAPPPLEHLQTGYVGPPPTGFGGAGESSAPLNPLAVISVVLGVLCCVPFAAIGALITGGIAHKQVADSNGLQRGKELAIVGMVLGALGTALGLISVLFGLLGRLH